MPVRIGQQPRLRSRSSADERHPEGRSVGIFVDDGTGAGTSQALRKAAERAGAMVKIVAPK
ncbi:MAG TPA: hypothetical protein VFK45_06750 [Gammaproteobacteria bacterium]|nr:hypothetical protein [Gammaproteobacteria bacterium]